MDEQFDAWSGMAVLLTLPLWFGFMKLCISSPAFRWWGQLAFLAAWAAFTIVAPIGFLGYRLYHGLWFEAAMTALILPLSYITAVVGFFWCKRLWTLRVDATRWREPS